MLRFGVIGTNFISHHFVDACRASGGRAEAAAVHSRTLAKAQDFAGRHGIATAVDSLDSLFDAVDAVQLFTAPGQQPPVSSSVQ